MVRVLEYGDAAVLVELDDLASVLALDRQLRDPVPWGVTELIPAARTLLVRYDPARTGAGELRVRLERRHPGMQPPPSVIEPRVVEVPVAYDGPDLIEVARRCGLSVGEVIERHCAPTYTVAYLDGLDAALRVPRRGSPRTQVPAGAVAIADRWAAIYPVSSPGGWQILGSSDLVIWDFAKDPPTLLAPGVRLRFRRRS
jgi:KipI family sensor histidine kinase inhibitor